LNFSYKIFRPLLNRIKPDEWQNFLDENVGNASMRTAFFLMDGEQIEIPTLQRGVRLKQDLLTTYLGITSGKNHFLYDVMEKTVEKILPAGILQQSKSYELWMSYRKNYEAEEDPLKILTIDDLRFLFTIWMCSLGMAVILFLLEMLAKFCKFCKKTSKMALGLVLLLMNLKGRLEYKDL
jgi:hypothetical protein